MHRIRLTVFGRLLLTLVAVAALPTVTVVLVQQQSLSEDLETAAGQRLDRAARAAAGLLDGHLAALAERVRAVSGTPQFRATLELDDVATLAFYAGELARREGAAAVGFVSASGEVATGGDAPELALAARDAGSAVLLAREGRHYAITRSGLRGRGQSLGTLVVVEELAPALLEEWSTTCGASVSLVPGDAPAPQDRLARSARSFGDWELRVTTGLEAERLALAHARRSLILAGATALAIALVASVFLSRGWVRPILELQHATARIGSGDFEATLGSRRNDEIGDVSRAFDEMTARLRAFGLRVAEQQRALEEKVGELGQSQSRLRKAQRLARMGSFRFDVASGWVEASEELGAILGLPEAENDRHALKDLLLRVHPEDRESLQEAGRMALAEGTSLHVDHRVLLSDGSERVMQTQAQVLVEADDHIVLEGTAQDVTERWRVEEQIRFLALHDALTGLGNRRMFVEQLGRASKLGGQPFGVLVLDLDHFKRINDTLGHAMGDRLLRAVADRLVASAVEPGVAPGERISRFGGDEFTVLATSIEEPADLARKARELLSILSQPYLLDGHEIVITTSVGIACWPDHGDRPETVLQNADVAMHHAKKQGRNGYQAYEPTMNEEAMKRLRLESRLRRAIENDELAVHYQPKLDRSGRELIGLEALVRWDDPELGPLGPDEFIPVAEETGLISALGERVLWRACTDCAEFVRQGMRVTVSVNLSAQELRDDGLPGRVEAALEASGLEPGQLELEITESMLVQDEKRVIEILAELRGIGVSTSVDDFGTGYSSLAYLGRLPVDALKIDRSFVRGIAEHSDDAVLAEAIVAMGHALRLRVIAEGVETREQQRLLEAWGCDELQGFLFARAMPADRMVAWWNERRGS